MIWSAIATVGWSSCLQNLDPLFPRLTLLEISLKLSTLVVRTVSRTARTADVTIAVGYNYRLQLLRSTGHMTELADHYLWPLLLQGVVTFGCSSAYRCCLGSLLGYWTFRFHLPLSSTPVSVVYNSRKRIGEVRSACWCSWCCLGHFLPLRYWSLPITINFEIDSHSDPGTTGITVEQSERGHAASETGVRNNRVIH